MRISSEPEKLLIISDYPLSELIPGQYVSTTARIAYVRTSERTDALGTKVVFTGIMEDATCKISFVSHRVTYPLIRNSIYTAINIPDENPRVEVFVSGSHNIISSFHDRIKTHDIRIKP